MTSDLHEVPHKTIRSAMQIICPKCGCTSDYKRDVADQHVSEAE